MQRGVTLTNRNRIHLSSASQQRLTNLCMPAEGSHVQRTFTIVGPCIHISLRINQHVDN